MANLSLMTRRLFVVSHVIHIPSADFRLIGRRSAPSIRGGNSLRIRLGKLPWNRNPTSVSVKTGSMGPLERDICKQRRRNDTDAFRVVSFAALDTIRLAYCPDYLTWREGVERGSEVPRRNGAPFL